MKKEYGNMKQLLNKKLFSTIIFLLSIMVVIKLIWVALSFLFLPKSGESYTPEARGKALYYRVKFNNKKVGGATPPPIHIQEKVIASMKGIKLLAIYNASDKLVVTVEKANKSKVLSKDEAIDGFVLKSGTLNDAFFEKSGQKFKLSLNNVKDLKSNGQPSTNSSTPSLKSNNSREKSNIIESDGRKLITRDLLTSYTKDVDKIWKDIGISDNKIDGKLNGFKVNFVKKGSDFEKLGLHRGDILTSINGEELSSYGAAMNFFKEIENIENLTLTVERNGKSEDIEYEIK